MASPSQQEIDDAKALGIRVLQLSEVLNLHGFSSEEADFEKMIFRAEGVWRDLGWSQHTAASLAEPDLNLELTHLTPSARVIEHSLKTMLEQTCKGTAGGLMRTDRDRSAFICLNWLC